MIASTWSVAFRAALEASWRLMIVVTVMTGVPLLALSVAVAPLGAGPTSLRLCTIAVTFPLSIYIHELAHATAFLVLAARSGVAPEQFGVGRWSGGHIVRWPLSRGGDALVAAAGPLAGVSCSLVCLMPGGAFLVVFPFVLLFCTHLASLRASADDGAQVRALWRGILA